MPFWSITNVLILELAIIRRILSENACPKQHFSQPATLRDSWCPTLSISTDIRVPREVLGGEQTPFPGGSPCLPSSSLLAALAAQRAWGAKERPAPSPAELRGGHSQNSPLLGLAEPGCSVHAFLTCWTSSTGPHARLQQADTIWESN